MTFLVASDSHGYVHALLRAYDRQPKADGLIFLGDGLRDLFGFREAHPGVPILAVRGNCDFVSVLPDGGTAPICETRVFENVRIFMVHGHAHYVKSGTGTLAQSAARAGASVVLYGHTHEQETHFETVGKPDDPLRIQFCNPGSIGYGGEFATLTLQNGQALVGLGRLDDWI